jgi:hypothetical protein
MQLAESDKAQWRDQTEGADTWEPLSSALTANTARHQVFALVPATLSAGASAPTDRPLSPAMLKEAFTEILLRNR